MQRDTLPLTHERVQVALAAVHHSEHALYLLRWLIWFPLLSLEQLTRLEQARLASHGKTRHYTTVAAQLAWLEAQGLVAHLIVNEPGWPPRQRRSYVTDLGLYVFAAGCEPPLLVARLASAYPVTRSDLLERLAHLDVHLTLLEIATRLIAEGSRHGFSLLCYQQPWTHTDALWQRRQALRLDAAFVLVHHHQQTEHAFFLRIDPDERRILDLARERRLLRRVLTLRQAAWLQHGSLPRLLLITGSSRLLAWATLLEQVCVETTLLEGAATTLQRIRREGIFAPIWWPFAALLGEQPPLHRGLMRAPAVPLAALLGPSASQELVERFSQRSTFAHLYASRASGRPRSGKRPLPSFVGKPLLQHSNALQGPALTNALRGTYAEQREAAAQLTLILSATQKELLFWLAHHPLLTLHQLAALLLPNTKSIRGVHNHLSGLASLNLLQTVTWQGGATWTEQEHYVLTETALRYQALREERPIASFLLSQERTAYCGPLTTQRGVAGLFAQMAHTHGLYVSICRLSTILRRQQIELLTWKSAREALRWYHHPLSGALMQIRPDAELLLRVAGEELPGSVLIEYDRATSAAREYEAKVQCYADYQRETQRALPPLLVITRDERTAARIHTCIARVAAALRVIVVLEEALEQQEWQALLR